MVAAIFAAQKGCTTSKFLEHRLGCGVTLIFQGFKITGGLHLCKRNPFLQQKKAGELGMKNHRHWPLRGCDYSLFLRGYIRIANEPFHRVESAVGSKGLFVHVGRRSQLWKWEIKQHIFKVAWEEPLKHRGLHLPWFLDWWNREGHQRSCEERQIHTDWRIYIWKSKLFGKALLLKIRLFIERGLMRKTSHAVGTCFHNTTSTNIDTNNTTDAYLLLDQSALMHYADIHLFIYPCPASV